MCDSGAAHGHLDRAAAVPRGVVDEVLDRLADEHRVGGDPHRLGRGVQRDPLAQRGGDRAHRGAGRVAQVHPGAAGLLGQERAAQLVQVVHLVEEPVDHRLRVTATLVQQGDRFDQDADGAQAATQLVRQHRGALAVARTVQQRGPDRSARVGMCRAVQDRRCRVSTHRSDDDVPAWRLFDLSAWCPPVATGPASPRPLRLNTSTRGAQRPTVSAASGQ